MKSKTGAFRKVTSVPLRGNVYRLSWRKPRITKDGTESLGLCDPPFLPHKKITIDPNVPEAELLDTIVHEALHGCYWDLGEEAISEAASDISQLLWNCGYRRTE